MRVLVINLDHQTERLEFQQRQLRQCGLDMQRVRAVQRDDPRVQASAYWDSWQRPLSPAERACLLSHRNAWEITLSSNAPCLVLEDDAVLANDTAALLHALQQRDDLDHVTLELRHRKKLLDRHGEPIVPGRVLRRLYLDRTGAAAYVLWPSGARQLLALADRHAGLADGLICECADWRSFQVEPAAAFQLDQCELLGLTAPIQTQSTITPSQSDRAPRHWRHRWRRLLAQLQMGWRQLRHWPRAQRRHVLIDPASFLPVRP